MGSVISKAIDLALEHLVDPVVLQAKYTFCYSSYIKEMKDAVEDLESNKQIIDGYVADDSYNAKPITKITDHWLKKVEKAQKEAKSLQTYEEGKTKVNVCCAQILINPIARNKLGRKAANEVVSIKGIVQEKPPREEISSKPKPRGIVNYGLSPEEAAQQINIVLSSSWNIAMEEVMTALKDDRINVVGLHGMGGVGKSTMINEVHVQVFKQSMFDEVAKVEVKAEVDITRIQEEIASALGLTLEKNSTAIRAADLRKRLLQKPNNDQKKKKTRVLIILDDLVEKLDLQVVGIPSSNDEVQIKLLLTSRDEYLISDKMRAQPIHLDVLSNLDALTMFKIVAGLENVGEDAKKCEKAKLIVPKCGGLPVVILAIANALKNKALKEWEDTLQRLDVRDALSNLEVSYEHLPSQESKRLFLLCGIIRGPQIQVRDLLKYTFGLGLYERKDINTLAAAATELEKLLSGLKAASMLLKGDDLGYVRIHDHMRDLAIMIVDRDRHEWVHFTLRDDRCEIPRRFNASKLELIFSYCEEGDSQLQVSDSFFKDMNKLYVLAFTNLNGRLSLPLPAGQLDHLRKLETLCLHKCSLSDVSMIGELKGLRILSFQGSNIRKIPIHLQGLTALKMLDLSNCEELTQIEPNVLGSLTKLEELNMENSFNDWEIEGGDTPSSNARLMELKNMSRLSNVRIHIPSTSMLPKDGRLFSSILTTYQIVFNVARKKGWGSDEDNDIYCEFNDKYNNFSRVLMLSFDSPDTVWQDWIQNSLQTAEVLYLSGRLDEKCESIDDMCIKGFDCLKHLRMSNCPSFRFIISSNDDYSTNLESLFLENLECLEKLSDGLPRQVESFGKLRVMKVYHCSKLTHLFDFSLLKGRVSSQLEEIAIDLCTKIQCIVVDDDNDHEVVTLSNLQKLKFRHLRKFSSFCGGVSSNVLFTGKKVAFPCLESLIIVGLDELEHIWDPTDPPAKLGNLRSLQVASCDKLARVINSNVLMSLQRSLESLSISGCGLMTEVFNVDDEHLVLFPRLKELELHWMDRLEGMHNKKDLLMMTIFPNIESLNLLRCPHLSYVLCFSWSTVGFGGFQNLKEIKIKYCEEMETIIVTLLPAAAAAATEHDVVSYSYSGLKQMEISDCRELRTFCLYLCSEQDSGGDDLPFFSQKEIFPCLESLWFEDLSELGEIWCPEVPPQTSFNMLKQVSISRCQLSVLFPSTLIPRLDNLTDISMRYCEQLRQIIIVEEKQDKRRHAVHGDGSNSTVEEEAGILATTSEMMFTFPCLRTLRLTDLRNLDRFYSSSASACSFQFPSLETLDIWSCSGVKTLFSQRQPTTGLVDGVDHDSDMVGDLFTSCDMLAIPNLKSIELYDLENFTEIWKGEKPQGLILNLVSLRLVRCANFQSLLPSFCNVLMGLTVESCNGFECLLTPLGATSLVHLTSLVIKHCDYIKEVVAVDDTEEATAASNENDGDHILHDITFRRLKCLQLFNLPKLEKFSSLVLNFPSLEDLDIQYCPNMTTFSSGILSTQKKFGDLNSFVQKNIENINQRYEGF